MFLTDPVAQAINQYPQLFKGLSGNDGIPELIVVGGVEVYDDKTGHLWPRGRVRTDENNVDIDVYAPSYLINCANNKGGLRNREEVTGTSLGIHILRLLPLHQHTS